MQKERYELRLYFYIKGFPTITPTNPDMVIPLKCKTDANDWIDDSVKEAVLFDKTNKQLTSLKSE